MSSSTSSNDENTSTPSETRVSTAKFLDPKIVSKEVNDYVLQHAFREDDIAKKLRHATASHPRSRMMGDPVEAAFFNLLLPAICAKKVIEIGVFTGYTTLILAKAVGDGGKVFALDVSEEFTSIGKPYFGK